ncbi:MAG TPA: HD domain-containing protein [Flavobacteriales bacterium]|nr:HD domain-containing protein [Flavobacteriales bacterium]
MNKKKIFNDPVYGFITLKDEFIIEIIDHPWFQRLRRISQLGLSHLVYPGAVHNRFHHAIGAMNLMQETLDSLKQKGVGISDEEELGAILAILLHDVGHGPFSHALEHSIVSDISHEELTLLIMHHLNEEFGGKLHTAIEIFSDTYKKKFLHQLVSSQLDMDRLDYLSRDSFYSGVSEGIVGTERIIKMLDVQDDQVVVEEKGIYSIEKYIVARRLMYWQVYLHKTVLSAEFMLVNILKRAKQLAHDGVDLFATPVLREFLYSEYDMSMIRSDKTILEKFCELDDYDVLACIKVWKNHEDKVLSLLSSSLLNRKLFKIKLSSEKWPEELISKMQHRISEKYELSLDEASYFVIHDMVDNKAYSPASENILIKMKDGTVTDLALASDHLNISALSDPVQKWFLAEYL